MLQGGLGLANGPFSSGSRTRLCTFCYALSSRLQEFPTLFRSRSRSRSSTNRTSLGASNPPFNHHALKPTQTRLHFPVPSLRFRSSNSHQSYTPPIPSLPVLSLYQYSMHTHKPKAHPHDPLAFPFLFFSLYSQQHNAVGGQTVGAAI